MSDFKFTDNSDKFINEMANKVDKALTAVGVHIEGEAKEELENSPRRIDTGTLRNSITHVLSGEASVISNYSGSSTHGDTLTTSKNKVANKPAPPP